MAISGPIRSVKTSTRASPGSVKTLIVPSRLLARPVNGLNWPSRVWPIQIPAASDKMTCLLQIASTIASTGGSTEYQEGSLIGASERQQRELSSCGEACAIIAVDMRCEPPLNHTQAARRCPLATRQSSRQDRGSAR